MSKHDLYYRDCSASEYSDDEPSFPSRCFDVLMFALSLVLILAVLVIAA